MWEILMGFMIGDTVGRSRYGRFVRLLLKVFVIGLMPAGVVYTSLVFLNLQKEY